MRFDQKLSAKVLKRVGQLRRLGAGGFVHTAYVRMLGPTFYSLTDPGRSIARGLHRHTVLNRALAVRLERLKERALKEVVLERAPLLRDIDPDADERLVERREPGKEILIGELGQEGTVLSAIGSIRGLRCVSSHGFERGDGASVELIDLEGRLGVRRSFRTDHSRFVQTLEAMLDLSEAGCPIAPVIRVDWNANAITSAFVPGTLLGRPATADERNTRRLQIEQALTSIHRAGYVLDTISEDDIIVSSNDDGSPCFVDLQHAIPLKGLSRDMSVYLRDADSRQVNACFGTRLITADRLRRVASPRANDLAKVDRKSDEFFVPVVLRDDIRWGKIWNPDVGTGRWNFIMKDHLPIPPGGSVLDLGSNNGFNPLQMLRSGAGSAVGVELNEKVIPEGEFLKSAYEWLDNRSYDFRYIHGSQADLPKFDLPRFDVVTALCSLYYMPEQEIRDLVRYIPTLTNVLVLQCNIDRLIDRKDEETYRKASVEFALEVLDEAGFTRRDVIAPPGYSRPLVIGRC
jgi:SAM-dependent methyltransferase